MLPIKQIAGIAIVSITILMIVTSCTEEFEPAGPDSGPLTIRLVAPQNGISVTDTVQILTELATDKRIVKVELVVDGSPVAADYYPPWNFDWITNDYEGTSDHLLEINAYEWGDYLAGSDQISLTVDNVAPAKVIDLVVTNTTVFSSVLSWTAPGDDESNGVALEYDIRYLRVPVTEDNWTVASRVETEPAPGEAGTVETVVANYLNPVTTYYFAMITIDEVGHESVLSENIAATTTRLFADPSNFDTWPVRSDTRQVCSKDIDFDGDQDIIVVKVNSHTINVFENNGDGSFQTAVEYETGGRYPYNVISVYLDRDAYPEIIVTNMVSDDMSIFFNNGDGTFQTPILIATGDGPFSIEAADFDGDADYDLVTANRNSHDLTVFLNYGDGSFAAPVSYRAGDSTWAVTVGDFNGDGSPDMAASARVSHDMHVFLNNGNGTFGSADVYKVGTQPRYLHAADFNGDEIDDLAVSNYFSGNVMIFTSDGAGLFELTHTLETGANPMAIIAADFDGDFDNNAVNDLVVLDHGGSAMYIFRNKNDGNFLEPYIFQTGAGPWGVGIADVNGDGDIDLMVTRENGNAVAVLSNNYIK